MGTLDLPKFESLDLEPNDGWLTVWFNEPERRNPLTAQRVRDLLSLCKWLEPNRAVRGVTFRGRGGVFCAGGDLAGFKAAFSGLDARDNIVQLSHDGARLFEAVNQLPQVVTMAVEGAVMAGGLGLACTADVVIARTDVKFAFTETRLGIPPAQIAPYVLNRLGNRLGRRLLLTGEVVAWPEALDFGMADYVVEDDSQMAEALDSVKAHVLKSGPCAVAATKELIHTLPKMDRRTQVKTAAEAFADCLLSPEGKEGVSSFLEKRKPIWASGSER